jgi:hypothetical protein
VFKTASSVVVEIHFEATTAEFSGEGVLSA